MAKTDNQDDYEEVLSNYYEDRGVSSLITIDIDTKKSDKIANEISKFKNVEDILLVTGDVDFVIKARFKNYDHMKGFLTEKISNLEGVKDVTSLMIVTAYKERGEFIEAEEIMEE
ncbi:MAG: Lrp/AsnC ligand binding domain-containing protein [Candidatus Thermoplasmatota archaeon]|nr:Lrp/AsnC ligand binding domain-containing protein [Candidatus Thermoplasmatota archaeon]MBS3789829.1 Lrp/AsnC ligand binding domain-containing protein [Candidatus Thermoplasmatota archaeon]